MAEVTRIAQVFVELADTLVENFDVVDFLQTLTDRCVELLGTDASGLMLSDQRGGLQVMTATMQRARMLELFELQIQDRTSAVGRQIRAWSMAFPQVRLLRGSSEGGFV
jgi:hypothetical protein